MTETFIFLTWNPRIPALFLTKSMKPRVRPQKYVGFASKSGRYSKAKMDHFPVLLSGP